MEASQGWGPKPGKSGARRVGPEGWALKGAAQKGGAQVVFKAQGP